MFFSALLILSVIVVESPGRKSLRGVSPRSLFNTQKKRVQSGSSAIEEAYQAVIGILSPGQQNLTEESLRNLFNTLEIRVQCGAVPCEKCNLLDAVHQLIGNHSYHAENEISRSGENLTVSVSQFPTLAAGCVLYLSSPGLVCNATRDGSWGNETDYFLHEVEHAHDHAHRLEERAHSHDLIDAHSIEYLFHRVNHHYEHLHSEHEICVTVSSLMKEINASSSPDQSLEMGAVLGRVLYHALQGRCFTEETLPAESFFVDYIMGQLGTENFTVVALESLMTSLSIGPVEHDHDHDHDHDHGHEHARANTTWDQVCFSAEQLIMIYGEAGSSPSSSLDQSSLAQLSPALVQQILSGACTPAVTEPVPVNDGLTTAERYIYATIANVIITLMAMFGIVILLCSRCTSLYELAIQFCISLAVGSLTGDALLHLLPTFLGLHAHSAGTDSHDHASHEGENLDYIYKMLVLIAGIYLFYLMETIFSLVTYTDNHQHGEDSNHHHDHGVILKKYRQKKKEKKEKLQTASRADLVDSDDDDKLDGEPEKRTREQRTLPYLITIGDGIHNFADGLAMGAAFALSWRSGLATTIAVFCHELPHELGDFAILLHSGLSVRKALCLNVGSALTSFIGMYIALSVATDLATKQWISAIAAGLFLYVGLADMLPTMVHINSKRPWLTFLLQNLGLLTGWVALLLLSLFEDRISF